MIHDGAGHSVKLLDYHRLSAAELEARDAARLEAAVRSECADFPERVELLLPPPDEKYFSGKDFDSKDWPHYQKLQSLCELYVAGTAAQREYIRSTLTRPRSRQLGLFRKEAREAAVRTKSEELLRLALVSLVIADLHYSDARDVILSLGALLVAAREIGADWGGLVRSAGSMAGPGMAPLLLDFLANHPS